MTHYDSIDDLLFQYSPSQYSTAYQFLQFIKAEHGGNISEQDLGFLLYEAGQYYDELSNYGGSQ